MKRVIIIGARRTRQGIGEFVARSFHQAGTRVIGVVGTSPQSAADAARKLHDAWGIEAEPYADIAAAIAADRDVDGHCADDLIVALCSPFAGHQQQLLEIGGSDYVPHLLCEKPMWWPQGASAGGGSRDSDSLRDLSLDSLEAETARLIDPFLDAGRAFELVTQWPQTLPSFRQLYPQLQQLQITRFEMLLSPISTSSAAVLDSMPHVLSMLQTVVGCGAVTDVTAQYKDGDRGELWIDFEYKVALREESREGDREPASPIISTRCRFPTCPERPRPAGYGMSGVQRDVLNAAESHLWVDRTIQLPAYEMGFRTPDGRSVVVPDPLELLVQRFCRQLDAGVSFQPRRRALVESVTQLQPLVNVVRDLEESE